MTDRTQMDRRTFLTASLMATAACGARTGDAPALTPNFVTTGGTLRGVIENGIFSFKGIPYGASTAGERRFLPPAEPPAWTGIRDATDMGPQAPQIITPLPEYFASLAPKDPKLGEDCLNLHIWTPGTGNARRPVMVWLHGGGFSVSSANWPIYNGAHLALQDVVVVTVNHRLNLFGFLHLADMGSDEYSQSTNLGMQDIVLALKWVRENIAEFNGDPNNVTVFGESGGAAKVSTLLGFAPARGLFHKAIVQSGSALTAIPRAQAARDAEAFLAKLNVKTGDLDRLQTVNVAQLQTAMQGIAGLGSGPVVDGTMLPADVFTPRASELGAAVPLLIGSNATETTGLLPTVSAEELDDAALLAAVKQTLPKASDAATGNVIAAYKTAGLSNREVSLRLAADVGMRAGVMTEAERKADQNGAPVYVYYLSWKTPVAGGKFLSPHTMDLPFVFDNLEIAKEMIGEGQQQRDLRDRMVGAWTAFARTGNPSHAGLPEWLPFETGLRATMILDNECRLAMDPERAQRAAVAAAMKA
jgi:para-nitrobenzyl esterase